MVGGLLGLGGGFILGPLFLELGIPPQVHSSQFLCLFFGNNNFCIFIILKVCLDEWIFWGNVILKGNLNSSM
jgi:uncharacterized membrane protein YfcA